MPCVALVGKESTDVKKPREEAAFLRRLSADLSQPVKYHYVSF